MSFTFDTDGAIQSTARDLISLVFKNSGVIGVGQDPLAEDINDAFRMLNYMLAQWARKRWFVYRLKDVSHACDGSTSYTVGTGANFNTKRPDRIEGAYFKQTNTTGNQISYPLSLLESHEDYARIAVKGLSSFPSYAFYDPEWPTGKLYVWPIPSNIYEVHILVKEAVTQFANLSDDLNMPPEYQAAVMWSLAEMIRPTYQLGPDPQVSKFAADARNTLYKANAQIPRLSMPDNLVRNGRYNIYSDRVN